MRHSKFLLLAANACGLLFASTPLAAAPASAQDAFCYPFYVGLSGGYGSTTWGGLVPSASNQNLALAVSTPTDVQEGGGVWGALAGYEFSPYFALELRYMHYPDANVTFDEDSLFAYYHDEDTTLTTHTETVSLMGKIMLIIPHTLIRGFTSAGAAVIHRSDEIRNHWRTTPTFGLGFNYDFTPHIMAEIAGNYTAGFGESELNPADDYMPFLYSVTLNLAYRF